MKHNRRCSPLMTSRKKYREGRWQVKVSSISKKLFTNKRLNSLIIGASLWKKRRKS